MGGLKMERDGLEQLGDKELDQAIAGVQQEYASLNSYYKTLQDERFHRWYMRNVIIVENK